VVRVESFVWKTRRRTSTARYGSRIFSSWWSFTWLVRTISAHSSSDLESGDGSLAGGANALG